MVYISLYCTVQSDVNKLSLNYPEKIWGAWARFGGGGCAPLAPT